MERSRASYAALALLVAASLAMTAWVVGARHELRQVEAAWAGAPACTGADVKPYGDGWVIAARPQMSCRITLEVTNRSGRDLRVDDVVAPRLGSEEPDFPVVAKGGPADVRGTDASYPADRLVRDGRTVPVSIRFGFRAGSCAASTTYALAGWPQVDVSLWQRSELLSAAGTLYVYDATDGGSCP